MTTTITEEGGALLRLVTDDSFTATWLTSIVDLGQAIVDAPPSDGKPWAEVVAELVVVVLAVRVALEMQVDVNLNMSTRTCAQ